jgi:hypothetical protein
MSIAGIAAAVVGGAGLIEGNQSKQAAKGTAGAAATDATSANAAQAAARAPYNTMALTNLQTPATSASLQSLYGANPTYTPLSDPAVTGTNAAATTDLATLNAAAPNYEAQAMQTLKDFQTAAAPQLQAGIKSIDQAAG